VDTQTGKLYGHVVADDPLTGLAYIIPAKSVFDDIRRRLGKEVRLPVDNVDAGHVILQTKLADRQCHAEKMSTVSSAATHSLHLARKFSATRQPSPNTEHISETFDQGVKCSVLVLSRVIFVVDIVSIFFAFFALDLTVRWSVAFLQTETIVAQSVNPRTEATAALRGERANVSST
jgi:hypothetical protein